MQVVKVEQDRGLSSTAVGGHRILLSNANDVFAFTLWSASINLFFSPSKSMPAFYAHFFYIRRFAGDGKPGTPDRFVAGRPVESVRTNGRAPLPPVRDSNPSKFGLHCWPSPSFAAMLTACVFGRPCWAQDNDSGLKELLRDFLAWRIFRFEDDDTNWNRRPEPIQRVKRLVTRMPAAQ